MQDYYYTIKQNPLFKLIKRYLFTLSYFFYGLIQSNSRNYYFAKWIKDDSENSNLILYPINKNGVVIDIGGYTGQFSDRIINLYNPYLYIYEPVNSYYQILKNKYANKHKIKIYNAGLSDRKKVDYIFVSKDSSSTIRNSEVKEKVKFEDIADTFKQIPQQTDLVSINAEGAEYVLIERLIKQNLMQKINFLQVQFHNFVPNASAKRKRLIKRILKTHTVRYSYPFVWESFELKKRYLNF